MEKFFIIFWATLILGSIAWYGFLVFYVGLKAGRDIQQMIKTLEASQPGSGGPPA